ncbi:MAG: 4Fe-4S binding protein, partial [Bacillota bacterium]
MLADRGQVGQVEQAEPSAPITGTVGSRSAGFLCFRGGIGVKLSVRGGKCSGCRLCELMCALSKHSDNNCKKAALRVRSLLPREASYQVLVCDQCGECAVVCPMGAIQESGGIYRIDSQACTGCGE